MINQDTFNDYSIGMVEILDNVQVELIAKISRQMAKGKTLSDEDWKVMLLLDAKQLQDSMANTVAKTAVKQADEIDVIKTKSANAGFKDADEQLKRLGGASSKANFFRLNEEILETVAEKLTTDTVNANLTMLRTASSDYVKMINETLALKETGVITRDEATKQVLKKWSKNGIPALNDSLGRRWQPDAYINMVVRTNSLQIAKKTQERRAVDYGYDLVLTSQHADQSDEHAPYANKIYSLTGNDPKYPPFSKATSAGFMTRPNCRHTYNFYFIGDKPKTIPKKETKENYKLSQEQRKLERKIREQKRVITSLDSAGYDTMEENKKLRQYQSDMRTFINESGRTRTRKREQI